MAGNDVDSKGVDKLTTDLKKDSAALMSKLKLLWDAKDEAARKKAAAAMLDLQHELAAAKSDLAAIRKAAKAAMEEQAAKAQEEKKAASAKGDEEKTAAEEKKRAVEEKKQESEEKKRLAELAKNEERIRGLKAEDLVYGNDEHAKGFIEHCKKEYADENIEFLIAVKKKSDIASIVQKFVSDTAPRLINLDSPTRLPILAATAPGVNPAPKHSVFDGAVKVIIKLLNGQPLKSYQKSLMAEAKKQSESKR